MPATCMNGPRESSAKSAVKPAHNRGILHPALHATTTTAMTTKEKEATFSG